MVAEFIRFKDINPPFYIIKMPKPSSWFILEMFRKRSDKNENAFPPLDSYNHDLLQRTYMYAQCEYN